MTINFPPKFANVDFDIVLYKWLWGNISEGERAELCEILENCQEFREDLCDWIKTLREPGEKMLGHKKKIMES